ncbi:hypothetical protein ColLi_12702 [Colletotrichum liriopes]|uniref:Ubiquitin-like protease family profile domain-containing protein n=1 Tax=Colletotrichum liriopes TaxID=708192 RepID=A0AA37GYV7_9PEZI|nr:hypothetical protein ColLi_12702 [Colletotrichum liriopes]
MAPHEPARETPWVDLAELLGCMARLEPGAWFNDVIINTLVLCLQSDSVAFIESLALKLAWHKWTNTPGWLSRALTRDMVLMLTHDQACSHWVLYLYLPASPTLHVYDPLGNDLAKHSPTTWIVAPFLARFGHLDTASVAILLEGQKQSKNCNCGVLVVAAAVLLARRNPQQGYAQSLPKDVNGDSLRRCFRAGLFSSTPTLPYEEGNLDAEAGISTGNAADTLVKIHQLATLFRLNRDVMGAVIPKGLRGCDSRARRFLTTEAELFSVGARAFGPEQPRRRHVDLLKEAFVVDEALAVEKARVMDASAMNAMVCRCHVI